MIGAGGMLGADVSTELLRRQISHRAFLRDECNVMFQNSPRQAFQEHRPSVVINCAAFTDVNLAESKQDLALAVNGVGAANVARACAEVGASCIYVSTDYVFDGRKDTPWDTDDPTNPLNVYGRTKLAGEQETMAALEADKWIVARTSWLYGAKGKNFVKSMLRLAREGKDVKIINDQTGAPTYTVDLARALVDLALAADNSPAARGIVHIANTGSCTWFEFAQEIFRLSGIQPASLTPCATSEYPTPARRPTNSRLSLQSLLGLGIKGLPPWQDGLRRYLAEIRELTD